MASPNTQKRGNPFYQAGWKPSPMTKEASKGLESLPDTMDLMPSQFFGQAHDHRCPGEKGLMLATLEQAVRDYQDFAYPETERQKRRFAELQSWFLDEDTSWPYSFLNLCETLSIDAPKIRRKLFEWRAQNPTKPVSLTLRRKCHSKD